MPWVYGEGFSEEQLEAVRALPFIDSAQLRMGMTGSAPEQGGAEMDLYLETEDLVSKPLLVEGAPFDPEDPDGIWLNRNFADAWQLHVGDAFTGQDDGAADWSGVSAVYSVSELREVYEEQMSIIWALIVAMVIFAVAMIVTVLYNSGNLSFHERIQEFATLRVLGFSAGRIRSLLTRQNFWLSLIGIAAGAPFANAMLEAMMNSNGENFDYYIRVTPLSYLLGGLVVLCIAMAVSFLFTGKIRKLDMVGTLKGAE